MLGKEKINKVRKNRMKKNTRQRNRLRWGHVLIGLKLTGLLAVVLGISALFVLGYAAVTRSDYFRAETIHVTGNQRLAIEEIIAQAGIQRGDNLLALNLRLVRGRLLDHAWIASARVARRIPKTITIEVKEHVPVARIAWERVFLVNTQGRIFNETRNGDSQDLPLVSGVRIDEVRPVSERLGPGMQSVMQVLRLSQQPSSAIAYAEIDRLDVDPELGITLTLKENGRLIKLGFEEYETKFERFKRLSLQLERKANLGEVQVVDLTIPDRVVVRLAAPTAQMDSQGQVHNLIRPGAEKTGNA